MVDRKEMFENKRVVIRYKTVLSFKRPKEIIIKKNYDHYYDQMKFLLKS